MSERYRFPARARIRRKEEFRQVYKNGVYLRAFPLRVHALKKPDGASRLGLSIRVRAGRSVLRNAWKRAVREAFRLHRHELKDSYDMVVSNDPDCSREVTGRVEEAFLTIAERLNRGDAGK